MPDRLLRPPRNSARALAERLRAFQTRELSLQRTLSGQFGDYFQSFRREIETAFFQHFVAPFDRPRDAPPATWDVGSSALADELAVQFTAGLAETEAEAQVALDDDLSDIYGLGYEQGLWEIYLAGLDTLDADDAGDPEAVLVLLADAGIDGVPYGARLQAWGGVATSQIQQVLAAASAGGLTLADTLAQYDGAARTATQGVVGLGGNELFRALLLGASLAYGRFGAAEVWYTQDDERVCPICFAKHLTITREQPIRDSHPQCRCWKLPLVTGGLGRRSYVSFSAFAAKRP